VERDRDGESILKKDNKKKDKMLSNVLSKIKDHRHL